VWRSLMSRASRCYRNNYGTSFGIFSRIYLRCVPTSPKRLRYSVGVNPTTFLNI
jgi:hypothetical protein